MLGIACALQLPLPLEDLCSLMPHAKFCNIYMLLCEILQSQADLSQLLLTSGPQTVQRS